jgi:galactokinase
MGSEPTHSAASASALLTELIARVRRDPDSIFSPDSDAWGGFAPGRLDVMGGIADYTGSLVCQLPLAIGVAALVQKRHDRRLRIISYNPPNSSNSPNSPNSPGTARAVELNLDDFYGSGSMLPEEVIRGLFTAENRWAAYIAGAFWVLGKNRHLTSRAPGANIACLGDLPISVGLGSSAAMEVAALSAITSAHRISLDPLDTAVLGQKIENHIVGAPCGAMDQIVSMMGRPNHLLLLRCQPHEIVDYIPIPPELSIMGLVSNVRHDISGAAYTNARVAAFMARKILSTLAEKLGRRKDPTSGYLARLDPDDYRAYLRQVLPESIFGRQFMALYGQTEDRITAVDPNTKYHVRAAADHHVLENARAAEFVKCFRIAEMGMRAAQKIMIRAGRLMLASHASYSAHVRLGSPQTDWIVRHIMQLGPKNGFYGARISAGGQGGTVVVLCDNTARTLEAVKSLSGPYSKQFGLSLELLMQSGPGAAAVGVRQFKPSEFSA